MGPRNWRSETLDYRSEAIEDDGRDPDLAKNLTTIGQVNVPEMKTRYRTVCLVPPAIVMFATVSNWKLHPTVGSHAPDHSQA